MHNRAYAMHLRIHTYATCVSTHNSHAINSHPTVCHWHNRNINYSSLHVYILLYTHIRLRCEKTRDICIHRYATGFSTHMQCAYSHICHLAHLPIYTNATCVSTMFLLRLNLCATHVCSQDYSRPTSQRTHTKALLRYQGATFHNHSTAPGCHSSFGMTNLALRSPDN